MPRKTFGALEVQLYAFTPFGALEVQLYAFTPFALNNVVVSFQVQSFRLQGQSLFPPCSSELVG